MTYDPRLHSVAALAVLLALAACSKPSATGSATAPETVETSGATPTSQAAAAPPPATSAPEPAASEAPVASTPPPPPPPTAVPATSARPPAPAPASPPGKPVQASGKGVKVVHIGMHIGGGPNDDVTKEPIRASVRPHFAELSACYAATGSKVESDFGVDLLIPEAGGKAQVSHPRSTLKGAPAELSTCIVSVFERTNFKKPLTGRTVVSYSMRFTPP